MQKKDTARVENTSPITPKSVSPKKLAEYNENYDFMDVHNTPAILRLIQSFGEEIKPNTPVFSDEIIRINSRRERKVRMLIVTRNNMYILIPKLDKEYSEKSHYKVSDIFRVEVARNNSLLLHVRFNQQSNSELLECFKRTKLMLFLKRLNKVIDKVDK